MEFPRQEYWGGWPCLLQGSSQPGGQTWVSCISCIGRQTLHHCTTQEAPEKEMGCLLFKANFSGLRLNSYQHLELTLFHSSFYGSIKGLKSLSFRGKKNTFSLNLVNFPPFPLPSLASFLRLLSHSTFISRVSPSIKATSPSPHSIKTTLAEVTLMLCNPSCSLPWTGHWCHFSLFTGFCSTILLPQLFLCPSVMVPEIPYLALLFLHPIASPWEIVFSQKALQQLISYLTI